MLAAPPPTAYWYPMKRARSSAGRGPASVSRLPGVRPPAGLGPGPALRPRPALLQAPLRDAGVMAREQDLGDRPAAPHRRPRVVRVLGPALPGGAEGLLARAVGVAERSRQ